MRLGCCVQPEYIPHVLTSGFDYVELQCSVTEPELSAADWQAKRDQLLSFEVPIEGFNVLLPRGFKVVGPNVDEVKLTAYLNVVVERIAELGGKHISFGSGGARTIPDGFDAEQAREQVLSFIQLLESITRPYSIQVNLEFLNQKESNLMTSLLEAHAYAKQVNQPSVRILADLYHMMEEQIPIDDVRKVRDSLGYVHVADTHRRYPGSGTYPTVELFQTLHAIGYDGPVSVECQWQDTIPEMASSAQFLRPLAQGVKCSSSSDFDLP